MEFREGMWVVQKIRRENQNLFAIWRLYEISEIWQLGNKVRGKLLYKNSESDGLVVGHKHTLAEEQLEPFWLQPGDRGTIYSNDDKEEFRVTDAYEEQNVLFVNYNYVHKNGKSYNSQDYLVYQLRFTEDGDKL